MNRFLFIATLSLLFSCTEQEAKRKAVQNEPIENFSNINYKDAPEIPYFHEITNLPIGFSLGDFNDQNSILYLTESANLSPLEDDNLELFLTADELTKAYETYVDYSYTVPTTRRVEFFPFERLVTKNYVLLILHKRKNDSNGRNYQFDLRTFTFEGSLISKLTMAKWDDDDSIYFGGWLMNDMSLKRTFRNGETELFNILENGEILKKEAD